MTVVVLEDAELAAALARAAPDEAVIAVASSPARLDELRASTSDPRVSYLIGGIFLIEAVSVMLQGLTFKWWGRRIFLIAPIHHHFEMKAWSETKIMVRFWIVTGILCAAGFALFYKYYPQIRGGG